MPAEILVRFLSPAASKPSNPRGKERTPHDLIPVEAQARLNQQSRRPQPAILKVRASFDIVQGKGRGERKYSAAKGSVFPQIAHRRERQAFIIGDAVQIQAELQIVLPRPLPRR